MVKTLRITSVIAAILAFFCVGLSVAFGLRANEARQGFIDSPGAVELFKAGSEKSPSEDNQQVLPLVKQAKLFALRINPPAPKKPTAQQASASTPKPRPPKVEAKFPLIGTCFYSTRPNQSLALIDLPAKGLRWIRQGDEVGHLIIEEIKDGLIVIRDGERTYELLAEERGQRTNLIRSTSAESSEPAKSSRSPSPSRALRSSRQFRRSGGVSSKSKSEEINKSIEFFKEIMVDPQGMGISPEEANQLRDIGSILEDLEQEAAEIEAPLKVKSRTTVPKQ